MRAQVALEYLTIAVFALLILTAILATIYHVQQRTLDRATQAALDNVADQLQQELLLAAQVHSGYERTFYLPDDVNGNEYTINPGASSIELLSARHSAHRQTPAYEGNPAPGENTVSKTNNTIVIS